MESFHSYIWLRLTSFTLFCAASSKQRMLAEDILKYDRVKIVPQVYMFRELAAATQNFHPELLVGEGGFGRVYKGQITRTNEVSISSLLPSVH